MHRLFIYLHDQAQQTEDAGWQIPHLSWYGLNAQAELQQQGQGSLTDLAVLLPSTEVQVIGLVPAEYALSLQVQVPGRSPGQIRRALPFVVEEFLATDIDQMHLACEKIRPGQPILCHVLAQQLLHDWLAALDSIGVQPAYLVLDADLLPRSSDAINLLYLPEVEPDRVLIRSASQSLATDPDNLPLILTGLLTALAAPAEDSLGNVPPLRICCGNSAPTELERAELAQEASAPLVWEGLTLSKDSEPMPLGADVSVLQLLATWQPMQVINLRQGKFEPPRENNLYWQHWRSVAALAAVWVLVAWAGLIAQGFWAGHQATQLEAQARALVRDYYPGEPQTAAMPLTTLRRELAGRIGAADRQGGFLDMLGVLAQGLQQAGKVELRNLSYQDARSELSVDLQLGDFSALERLRDHLVAQGIGVDISSAEQQDQGVRARLRVRG